MPVFWQRMQVKCPMLECPESSLRCKTGDKMKQLSGLKGLVPAVLCWLALACLLAGAASSALAAKTYSDNGDGTVTDPTTGLQWMRC